MGQLKVAAPHPNLLWLLKARRQHIASDQAVVLLRLLLLLQHNPRLLSVGAIHHDIINKRTACGDALDADNLLAACGFNDDFMVIHLLALRIAKMVLRRLLSLLSGQHIPLAG